MSGTTAIMLDAETLGDGLDLSALRAAADPWSWHSFTSPTELMERLQGQQIAVTNKVRLDADSLAGADALELVCIAATGTNNVDLTAAAKRGITVCNVRGYSTASVAQHTMALMLALTTRLPDYAALVRSGRWQEGRQFCLIDYPVMELAGRTLGIVGYGDIGRAVGTIAQSLGMHVRIAARPGATTVPSDRVALPQLLAESDVVSLHCPLTEETHKLIDADALARMKPDALLINTARGALIDEPALAAALRAGHLGGAGLDVLSEEPPIHGSPLLATDLPNLIVTPHSAWAANEARQRLVDEVAANIRAFLHGQPRNVVSAPATP